MKPKGALAEHSSALLHATTLRVWLKPRALEPWLLARGLQLSPQARRRERQVLLVELWHVQRGQLTLGVLPLRDALGVAFAGMSALPPLLLQSVLRSTPQAGSEFVRRSGALGASLGRECADAAIERYGNFHEVMLSIPDVVFAAHAEPCRAVVGMYTDSRVSQLGAATFRFHLGKELAQIARDADRFLVTRGTARLLEARLIAPATQPAAEQDELKAWLAQPLLGIKKPGAGAMSKLSYLWDTCQLASVPHGSLFIARATSEGVCPEQHKIADALHARDLGVRLSYPTPVRWHAPASHHAGL